ncbi:MAG: hypothetical protein H7062_09035 [Candidatus Saccharimonas sp.]|nr:hypothetical protein [Planctomycetaceae bacterium]
MAGIRRTVSLTGFAMPNRANLLALLCVSLALICPACNQNQEPSPKMSEVTSPNVAVSASPQATESANKALLDEANTAGRWFHAKKTRPIWARRLEAAQTVKTLEGEEQVAAGHYLCKGEAGDIWPQTEQNLHKRYTATDEVAADGWRKYQPHPDAQGVMATPINHPFEVQATWGQLTGKPGDFLVKNFQDRDTAYPADVWIVDQTLFRQTYESVAPGK